AADQWEAGPSTLSGAPSKDPWQELPVSSRPAVLPYDRALVLVREFLEQLEIGHESRPSEDPLEQVMAQHRGLRDPPRQGRLEGIHVVDALPRVGAFSEQVLVDVRDGGRIGVDPGRTGEGPLKQRPLAI